MGMLTGRPGGPLQAHRRGCHAWQAAGLCASQSWQVETTYGFCLATAQH